LSLAARVKEFRASSDNRLLALGMKPEDLEAFRAAEGMGKAATVLDKAVRNLDPQSETAKNATEALMQQLEAIRKSKSVADLPRVVRDSTGWTVIDKETNEPIGTGLSIDDAMKIVGENYEGMAPGEKIWDRMMTSMQATDIAFQETTKGDTAGQATMEVDVERRATQSSLQAEGADIDGFLEESAMHEQASGGDGQTVYVALGDSATEVKQGIRTYAQRLFKGGTVLTVFHEMWHNARKRAIARGKLNRDDQVAMLRAADKVLADRAARKPSDKRLTILPDGVADADLTERMIDEGMAELGEIVTLLTRKKVADPKGFSSMLIKNIMSFSPAKGNTLRQLLDAVKGAMGLSMTRAAILRKAQRDGTLDMAQIESKFAEMTGLSEQDAHQEAANAAAAEIDPQSFSVTAIVAPVRVDNLSEMKKDEVLKRAGSAKFIHLQQIVSDVAAAYGIKITGRQPIIGGWVENGNQSLEVPEVIEFDTDDIQVAEEMAALIAASAPELQNAALIWKDDEAGKDGMIRFTAKGADAALLVAQDLEMCGVNGFSYDPKTRQFSLVLAGVKEEDHLRVHEYVHYQTKQGRLSPGKGITGSKGSARFPSEGEYRRHIQNARDRADQVGGSQGQAIREVVSRAERRVDRYDAAQKIAKKAKRILKKLPVPMTSVRGIVNELKGRTFENIRALGLYLDDRFQKIHNQAAFPVGSQEGIDSAAEAFTYDILEGLSRDGSGMGWYDERVQETIRELVKMHPEFNQNPLDLAVYIGILATTSQGYTVTTNFQQAERVYAVYKQTGRVPSDLKFAKSSAPINGNLQNIQDLIDEYGLAGYADFMDQIVTGQALRDQYGFSPTGVTLKDSVRGNRILGPKIGSFFNNLRGRFDTITMDLWYTRTMHRYLGQTVSPITNDKVQKALRAFRSEIRKEGARTYGIDVENALGDDEATVRAALSVYSRWAGGKSEYSDKGYTKFKDGYKLEKAARTLHAEASMKGAPQNKSYRNYFEKVVLATKDKLASLGIKLTEADIQAIIWYAEKNMFAATGVANNAAKPADYLDAVMVARNKTSYSLQPVANRVEADRLFGEGKEMYAVNEMDGETLPITSKEMLDAYPPDAIYWDEPETSYSVTPEQDALYLDAVEKGGMKTAQRMVDEAARAAGYNVKAYHGTNTPNIEVFKKRGVTTNFNNAQRLLGYFFASDQRYAAQYGKTVMPVFLKGEFSEEPFSAIDRIENGGDSNAKQWKARRKEKGFTGAKFGVGESAEYVVFTPTQIKSADPVTYDSDGNVIPLSQRFDSTKDSISYSVKPISSYSDTEWGLLTEDLIGEADVFSSQGNARGGGRLAYEHADEIQLFMDEARQSPDKTLRQAWSEYRQDAGPRRKVIQNINSILTERNFDETDQSISYSLGRSEVTPNLDTKVVEGTNGETLVGPASFSIRAFHGTPHKVDRFTTEKIGTGEGAQAYGWGLYFAESEGTAKWYAETLSKAKASQGLSPLQIESKGLKNLTDAEIVNSIQKWGGALQRMTPEEARTAGESWANLYKATPEETKRVGDVASRFEEASRSAGNLYTVKLKPEAHEFLDWDKPLSEQSEKVKAAIKFEVVKETEPSDSKWLLKLNGRTINGYQTRKEALASAFESTGGQFYQTIAIDQSPRRASQMLAELGIPGIRYLDGNSRKDGDGSYNYVIFDENDIEITEENGTPVATTEASSYSLTTTDMLDKLEGSVRRRIADPIGRATTFERMIDKIGKLRDLVATRGVAFNFDAFGQPYGKPITNETEGILNALAILDGILSVLPVEVRGRIGGYTHLAKLTTNEERLDYLKRKLASLDKHLEKYLQVQYGILWKKLLDREQVKKNGPGKKPKGKAGADIHDLFAVLRMYQTKSVDDAQAHADGLMAQIAKGDLTPEEEAHKNLEAQLVLLVADWRNASAERRADLVKNAQYAFDEGYYRAKLEKLLAAEDRAIVRQELINATGKTGADPQARDQKAIEDIGLGAKIKNAALSLASFEQLVNFIFGENSAEGRRLVDLEREAAYEYADAVQAEYDAIEALFTSLAGGGYKGEQLRHKLSQKDVKIEVPGNTPRTMSQMEMITATLMWRQEDGRRHMRGHQNENAEYDGAWHYDQEFIDEIERKLSADAKRFRAHLIANYGKEWDEIAPLYRELNGINLPKVQHYSPITVAPQQAQSGQVVDPVSGFATSAKSNTPGSLRSRGQAIAEPNFKDAMQVYLAHRKQILHWKAYSKFSQEAQAILNNRQVGNAIEESAGKEATMMLRKWIDYFAEGGYRDAAAQMAFHQQVSKWVGRGATTALVGRLGVLAIQSTQLGASLAEMPTGSYLLRLGKLLTGNLGWAKAFQSSFIQRRLAQMPVMVQAAMEGLAASKPGRVKFHVQQIGRLIGGADALFTAGTFAMVYDFQFTQARKQGMDEATAAAFAEKEAERIVERIAQPTRAGTRSYLEVSAVNPIWKLSWAFASEARQKLALSAFTLANPNASAARKARAVAVTWVVGGLVASLIRAAWRDMRDDDDEEVFDEKNWGWKRLALSSLTGPLGGIPVLGDMAETGLYALAGEYLPQGNMLSAVARTPKAISNIPEWFTGERDLEEAIKDAEVILSGMGIFNDTIAAYASLSHLARDLFSIGKNLTDE
jgi:hypothetical protein